MQVAPIAIAATVLLVAIIQPIRADLLAPAIDVKLQKRQVNINAKGREKRDYLTTCARDGEWNGLGSSIAHKLCQVSCKQQNCGNGNCEFRQGRKVCVCSRCAPGGGSWPPLPG